MRERELVLVRTARGNGEVDAAHAAAHLGPELQQLEANGCDGGIGELAVTKSDTAQGVVYRSEMIKALDKVLGDG